MKNRMEDIIEEALKSEPKFELRKDFKDQVVQAIRKKELKSQRRLYIWMAFGTLIIFGFGYATISFFLPSLISSFSGNEISQQLIPSAILVGIAVIIVQYLDKRLVKEKFLQV